MVLKIVDAKNGDIFTISFQQGHPIPVVGEYIFLVKKGCQDGEKYEVQAVSHEFILDTNEHSVNVFVIKKE